MGRMSFAIGALVFLFVFCFASFAQAGERDPLLKLLIKKGIITEQEARDLEKELKEYEAEKPAEGGLLSVKGAKFEIGGELEYEFVATEGDGSEDEPHFQLDKVVLQPKVKIGDNLKMSAQVYVQESKAYLNEVHAKYSGLLLNSWIDAGLYERWLKSHHGRKTEGYTLLGTSFYRDDALTLTWGGDIEPVYWMFSVGNGYEIDSKQVAEDGASKSKIIHDDHSTSGLSDRLEYGVNIGVKPDFGEFGRVDVLGFYYWDKLSEVDRSRLQDHLPGYTSDDDDKSRLGVGVKYKIYDATIYGAYIDAEDGQLDRDSWLAEASYHFKLHDGKWFTGFEPLVSYSDYNVDNTKATGSPWSWDREKWMFAGIVDLYKNTKLKLEYYLNDEKTGGEEIDNDEFLAQLEVKF